MKHQESHINVKKKQKVGSHTGITFINSCESTVSKVKLQKRLKFSLEFCHSFHMTFLTTINFGNGHFAVVVPTEKRPLPSPEYVQQKGQKKPQVRGRGSEGGLRSKWDIQEGDLLPEQLGF